VDETTEAGGGEMAGAFRGKWGARDSAQRVGVLGAEGGRDVAAANVVDEHMIGGGVGHRGSRAGNDFRCITVWRVSASL